MSVSIPFVGSWRSRRRPMAALVSIDREQIWIDLAAQPPVGATLDLGFPAVVTESRQVAGGGLLIAAERVSDNGR